MALEMSTVIDTIGERLRSARERAGLTLDQTAERAGMSKAHLSRLESAERQPSISALLALASALALPVSALLGEDRDGPPLAIWSDTEPRDAAKGLFLSSCSGYPGSSALEALRITVTPDRPDVPAARHRGEEWIYVLRGTLRLEYDGSTHYLEQGSTAHFDAERPHRLGTEGPDTEIVLVAAQERQAIQIAH
jgi:transcriptional regulator with XRE-family HTH domain